MSQSTNNVYPTANHISILRHLSRLENTMIALKDTFVKKGQELDDVIKMGRTHLQDAVPIRLGQEFKSYSSLLERDLTRVKRLYKPLLEINIEATAVGTGLNANSSYVDKVVETLQKSTDYKFIRTTNLIDATQNTDAYTQIYPVLKICMTNMSKIANDLRLMASGPRAGLNEISIPSVQPGSSIMPGKINPVICEVVNQTAFQVIGNDQTVMMASESGQFELNVMEPVLFYNIQQSLHVTNQVLDRFNKYCIKGIQANTSVCKSYVENSIGTITAINPHIGYEKASSIAKEALPNNKSIKEIILRDNTISEEYLK